MADLNELTSFAVRILVFVGFMRFQFQPELLKNLQHIKKKTKRINTNKSSNHNRSTIR